MQSVVVYNVAYCPTFSSVVWGSMKYLLILFSLVFAFSAQAKETRLYPGSYSADVYYIIDGDTFFARAHLWPGLNTDVNIRILGLDTPETWRPKCDEEKVAGKAATEFLMNLFGSPYRGAVLNKPMATVELRIVKRGKYAGQMLADVFYNGENVTDTMLNAGHGRPYDGGKRRGWCE